MALRNLLRNRRRSSMTLLAMVLGLVAILLFGGYIKNISYGLQTGYVQLSGHLQIQRKGYFLYGTGNPAAYGIRDYEKIIDAVKRDPVLAPMLVIATPTLHFGGIGGNFSAGVSRTIYVSGVIVDDQDRMRDWNDYGLRPVTKSLALSGTAPDSAVIGIGVARVLRLCAALKVPDCANAEDDPVSASSTSRAALPDDIASLAAPEKTGAPESAGTPTGIEILAATPRGAPNVASVNVIRAEYQGVREVDDVYVGLHLAQAQTLIFGKEAPRATAIVLQLRHTDQIAPASARLEQIFATSFKDNPLELLDYETLNPFYGQTVSMFNAIFGFMSILIGAVVLFTIGNTMSMAVFERTVEIGTVRALGVRRRGVRAMFLTEAIVLGVGGALLGVVIAMAVASTINLLGLTWLPPGRIEPVSLEVRVVGEHLMMAGSVVGLVVVASLSAILPAARASRMNIVDALRHV